MSTRSRSTNSAFSSGLLVLAALLLRVPFDFRAGGTHFGPGEYVLAMDGAPAGSATIRSAAEGRSAVVHLRRSSGAGGRTAPTVSFRAYGDSRFLSAIQEEGGARWEIAPSTDEATLVRAHGRPRTTSLKVEPWKGAAE